MKPAIKECKKCSTKKPISDFSKDAQKSDLLCSHCKECQRKRQAAYRAKNRQEVRVAIERWSRANRSALSRREIERRQRDVGAKVSHNFSTRVRQCLRGSKGGRRWADLVGYTSDELIAHLASQFARGMGWDNYGQWHIDHIVPLSAFDIREPGDPAFKRAWGLPNLRPAWAAENLRKGATREFLL